MSDFTHFDDNKKAIMVDVSNKEVTLRTAVASGKITVGKIIFDAIENAEVKKGDVLSVATTAGIMAAKKTFELIPMCHILPLESCRIEYEKDAAEYSITAKCTVKITGKTGVEMEALTGVCTALLTIYDMCKALDKGMVISDVHLVSKSGGKSGEYICPNA